MKSLPLHGVRILDLSRILAGPLCGQILADLGATVIKWEHPQNPDETRRWGPPFVGSNSAYYSAVNRNKKGIALDLKSKAGQEVLSRIIPTVDLVLENFLPMVAKRLKVTPEALRQLNPKVIVISISGFGKEGPAANRPGFDFIIQAMSGLMGITGEVHGAPMKVGVALCDVISGLYAALGAIAALYGSKHQSDAPQHLDVPMMGATIAAMTNVTQSFLVTGQAPLRYGNAHPSIVPYECFPTLDGQIAIAAGTEGQFRRLMMILGLSDLVEDQRFSNNAARVKHREELISMLSAQTKSRSTSELEAQLLGADVPSGPVQDLKAAAKFWEQTHPGSFVTDSHGTRYPALPIAMDGAFLNQVTPPPTPGADTVNVLREVGFSEAEIEGMI